MNRHFGDWLKDARLEKGISLKELSKLTKIDINILSKIERKVQYPDLTSRELQSLSFLPGYLFGLEYHMKDMRELGYMLFREKTSEDIKNSIPIDLGLDKEKIISFMREQLNNGEKILVK